ncbi:MAG: hypothetical protein ACRENX_09030 [Candidatus Dormibacteria bacterium]
MSTDPDGIVLDPFAGVGRLWLQRIDFAGDGSRSTSRLRPVTSCAAGCRRWARQMCGSSTCQHRSRIFTR